MKNPTGSIYANILMVVFQWSGEIIGEFYLLFKKHIFRIPSVNIYYLHNLGFKYFIKVFLILSQKLFLLVK